MKQILMIILLYMSFILLISCSKEIVDSKSVEVTSTENVYQEGNKITASTISKENPLAKNSGKCPPKNVPIGEDLPENKDINDMIPLPKNREEFNNWLKDIIGSVQVATLDNRKFIEEYYHEGDLNGDGCQDIAIVVQVIKDKSGTISMENFAVGTTLQNLNSKADAERLKPKQDIALAIVFGGRQGWSWKNNATGKMFLLYDSIFKPTKVSNYELRSTIFYILEKNKPTEDDEDLIDLIPANAAGDCVYTATQIKRKKVEYSEMNNRFLICFDGKLFFDKDLPDSKSYPDKGYVEPKNE